MPVANSKASGMKTRHSQLDGAADSARPAQRKRTRQPSVDAAASSQPAVAAAVTTTTTTTTTKRSKKHVKRGSVSDNEQLSHELQDAVDRDEPMEAVDENDETAPQHRSKRVRFSNAGATSQPASTEPVVEVATPSAGHTGAQRTSLSPAVTPHPAKAQGNHRASLSTAVESSPNGLVAEFQFSPLRTVLNDRVKRQKRKSHLSEEIGKSVEEHDAHDAMSDHGQLTLVEPADLNISPEDMTPRSSLVSIAEERVHTNGGRPSIDPTYEDEIRNFERIVAALTREASDARATLQILAVELQGLGFTEPDEGTDAVLSSIRTAFHQARLELEELLPSEEPNKYNNKAFLNRLIENIRSLVNDVQEKTALIAQHDQLEAVLRSQNNGLLDKLAEVDARKQQLETRWQELDAEGERKEKAILELEQEVESWKEQVEIRDDMINQKDTRISALGSDVTDHAKSIERLNTALKGYGDEVKRLEGLISRMEKDHSKAIAQLQRENAIAVEEMGQKFQTETERREIAENELDEATTKITELELRIEKDERELEKLRETLAAARAYGDQEKAQREEVEAELDDKTADIQLLEERVEGLENNLTELTHELQELRNLAEAERRQREAAEAELDQLNTQIAALEKKLHEEGVRANELRQKLFETQMQKEKAVKDMQEAAAEREEQFQNDMQVENDRRQAAERTAAGRNVLIAELEEKIRATEAVLLTLTMEKDTLIAHLESRILDLEQALEALRQESRAALADKENQIAALHNDLATLTDTLSERAELIAQLQNEAIANAQANQLAYEAQQGVIADLNSDLAIARDRLAKLEAANLSLEGRVQEEAEQMLALQSAHADETQRLNDLVRARDQAIAELNKEANNRQNKHTDTLKEKDSAIQALQVTADARAATIAGLSEQIEALKARYRREVEAARNTVDQMAKGMRNALENAEGVGRQYEENSQRGLEEVEKIGEGTGVGVSVNGGVGAPKKRVSRVHEQVKVVKAGGKKGAKKRQFDSGFGVASDEADEEVAV